MNVAYIPGFVLRPLLLTAFVGGAMWLHGAADAQTALWALTGPARRRPRAGGADRVRHPSSSGEGEAGLPHLALVRDLADFLMIDGFRMLLDNTDVL